MSSINGRQIVAIDCEMVEGVDGSNILARVSIVDYHGNVIFDSYVSSQIEIADYRTPYSGVRPDDLIDAPSFSVIQKIVRDLISNKILVGYSLNIDLGVLELTHPIEHQRDIKTSRYIINMHGNSRGQPASLKKLTWIIFQRRIQVGEHDSIEDATATMDIYKYYQREIENENGGASITRHFQPEETESGTAVAESATALAGTVVLAGIAAAGAFALFNFFRGNNRND